MPSQIVLVDKKLFETIRDIDCFSLDDVNVAKEIFIEFVTRGVILNCDFNDYSWTVYDEYSKSHFEFNINALQFKRAPVFNTIKLKDFELYLKMFVIGLFGKYVAISIQSFLREVRELIRSFDGKTIKSDIKLPHANLAIDLLNCIQIENSDEYECLIIELERISEDNVFHYESKRRRLSTFQSYFKFNDLIKDYWNSDISNEERIFYFPIYLWWHITAILPLRPREFLLIPRDCFRDSENLNKMTFRRNKLKGSRKKVSYNIKDDYELCSYELSDRLAEQVRNYILLTNELEINELDTLFRTDKHYNFFGRTKRYDSRFFTYANMRYCLSRFYSDIIGAKYKCNVIYSDESTDESIVIPNNSIELINIGDTRHIAMINIIASGGTPTTAMMLAWHSSIDMSSHYYANISTMIECRTYKKYSQTIESDKSDYVLGTNYYSPAFIRNNYVELENGSKCYSELFIKGTYDDCIKAVGDNGEIGDCNHCTYYRASNYDIFINDDDIYKSQISNDCDILAEQINLYRQGKGYEENIKQAILKLKASTKSYEKFFVSKLKNGEKNNGKN